MLVMLVKLLRMMLPRMMLRLNKDDVDSGAVGNDAEDNCNNDAVYDIALDDSVVDDAVDAVLCIRIRPDPKLFAS
jgi:hypothetical protein